MKTVKDFKDAGLEIISGDMVHGHTNNPRSAAIKITDLMTHSPAPREEWTIAEFAWRENAGVKPDFSGMIDAITSGGDDHTELSKDFDWVVSDSKHSITKWRPSLDQSKPIQTETPEEKEALDEMFKRDISKGSELAEDTSKPVTVTHEGNVYEIGKPYLFSDTGKNWVYQKLTTIYKKSRYAFGCLAGNYLHIKEIPNGLGTITPAPIDLIDGNAYMFNVRKNTFLGFYRANRNSFFYEIENGNKIAGVSECTNIRPMTVAESK